MKKWYWVILYKIVKDWLLVKINRWENRLWRKVYVVESQKNRRKK